MEAGEAIMVVESDKADMDVEAFEDGFLAKILTAEGDMAPVGNVVALVASAVSDIPTVIAAYEAAQAGTTTTTTMEPAGGESTTTITAAKTTLFMPALSSTMSEGKVVAWLKNIGDYVTVGDAIMVIESDKADMDVEAFDDGYLADILVSAGETAVVGAPLGIITTNWQPSYTTTTTTTTTDTMLLSNIHVGVAVAATFTAAPDFQFAQIDMPALSSTMKEGKVVSWLKAEGDAISSGEAIMVVESDKADMDVEAFEDGFLAAIITQEGQSGAVGAPVALIAMTESDIPALQAYAAILSGAPSPAVAASTVPATTDAAPKVIVTASTKASTDLDRVVASPLAKKRAEELGLDIGDITGNGPNGRVTAADVEAAASKAPTASKKSSVPTKGWTPAPGVIAATPMARALAKKAKIDLASISGTGEFGRVTVDDVKIATGEKKVEKKAAPTKAGATAVEMPSGFVPFTGMQRAVSKNMEATLGIPEFRVSREIEMDKFDALYQSLKSKGVTVSALIAKAVALAVEKHPIINSSYSSKDGGGILFNKDINIAMAVAIDGGLITPTLKNANERSIIDLGEDWKNLVGKAKAGTLKPDEYNSGTFTISNMGMFGVTQFGAILPAGSGGILAIGATQEHIVPCNQAILGMKKIKKMTVTLTCDHRQIYGSDAALFLKTLADIMENQLGSITA